AERQQWIAKLVQWPRACSILFNQTWFPRNTTRAGLVVYLSAALTRSSSPSAGRGVSHECATARRGRVDVDHHVERRGLRARGFRATRRAARLANAPGHAVAFELPRR